MHVEAHVRTNECYRTYTHTQLRMYRHSDTRINSMHTSIHTTYSYICTHTHTLSNPSRHAKVHAQMNN